MNILFSPDSVPDKWDDIEVNPVWDDGKGNCEVCDEGQEHFWSVYLHSAGGGVQCIADLPTKQQAIDFAELLKRTVKNYTDNGHLE